MQLIRGLHNCPKFDASVLSIGNFDGMHTAHLALIKELTTTAKVLHLPAIVVSFYPHPSKYFGSDIALLMGLREKYYVLQQYGVEVLLCIHFTTEFANLSPREFILQILMTKLNAKHIVIGDDFKFGKFAQGDASLLKQYMPTTIIKPQLLGKRRVSSSNIRYALTQGDMSTARHLLGYTYYLGGRVVKGLGIAKTMVVPTANINVKNRILVLSGVFVAKVTFNHITYNGIVNIGKRPTIRDDLKTSVEVHIFDFNANIYGEYLKVAVIEKIRNEQKFTHLNDLALQIKKDIAFAKTKV